MEGRGWGNLLRKEDLQQSPALQCVTLSANTRCALLPLASSARLSPAHSPMCMSWNASHRPSCARWSVAGQR